jgi:acyl carrier protein
MTDDEKIKFIEDAILQVTKKSIKIKPEDRLLDLTLDSLDIVELVMYYEDKIGIELDPEVRVMTVNDMMVLM